MLKKLSIILMSAVFIPLLFACNQSDTTGSDKKKIETNLGALDQACYDDGTCNEGLTCKGGTCVEEVASGDQTCTYTYSEWGACQSSDTQTRTVVSKAPDDCTGTPVISRQCDYSLPNCAEGQVRIDADCVNKSQVIAFSDTSLKQAVIDSIKQQVNSSFNSKDVTIGDCQKITALDASCRAIKSIGGIKYCTELESLDLSNYLRDATTVWGKCHGNPEIMNNISNIQELAYLTNLTWLNLYSNQISDISKLAYLTNLTSLALGSNQISDISKLAYLTNLTSLNLNCNQISDISKLAGLTNLTSLELGSNQISDVSKLAYLTNLTWLNLYSNQIRDISKLAGLTNLTSLYLHYNFIKNINPLVTNAYSGGLGQGDSVILDENPLNVISKEQLIPILKQYGVTVSY